MIKQIDCVYRKANWKLIDQVESIVFYEKYYCIVWNLGMAYSGNYEDLNPKKNPLLEKFYQLS